MDVIRVGPAPAGSTPFDLAGNFDSQKGRRIDFGHAFDAERGYRVFFKFRDSAASNTWGPESLLKWGEGLLPADPAQVELKRIAIQQARQCITLNQEWARLGKPIGGVPMSAKGRA